MRLFSGINELELKNWLAGENEPLFRASQLLEWVFQKKSCSFEEMTNLPKALRIKLQENFLFPALTLAKIEDSKDQETIKFLWKLPDGMLVESVLICSGERRTACVSSQVGCNARCAFCASGKEGLKRNLDQGEILEQALHMNRYLQKNGEKLTNVVFMGMGEPLENYDAVIGAIRGLIDPKRFHLSQRRITVSTVGVVEGIEKFKSEGLKVNFVLSLHAPNQHVRKKIIPYARKYPLEDVLDAMQSYSKETGRDITYEYILIAGINDQEEHAKELAKLLSQKQCSVNLIPYNPVEGLKLKRPEPSDIERFRETLCNLGVKTTWRYTKGKDIAAACGQLALKKTF